jgi:hypothetical protein
MNIPEILKQKYPDPKEIRFDVYQDDKRKSIFLSGFIVNPLSRGKGVGSGFMEDLTQMADEIGYKITLTPDSSYGGNLNRLKDFYPRFGFVFNKGDNRDFSHKEDMYRLPKEQEINEEGESTSSGSSTGNAKATGKKWESGVVHGKANPIANTGQWESGVVHGKANPVSTNENVKLNEQIIRMREMLNLNEKAIPQTIQKNVGNVLFGSNPKIADIQQKEPEENTPLETQLLKNLKGWTQSSTDSSASKVISTLDDLLKLKKYFPEVLNPPYSETAYRGTSINIRELNRWIKENPSFDVIGGGNYLKFRNPYPYRPRRDVSSWTTSMYYSTSFRGREFEDFKTNVGVVFETKIDDTFIMNPSVMNIIFKHTQGDLGYEQEAVREEDEVIKFSPDGEYYMVMDACTYKIFNPSYEYDGCDEEDYE